MKNLSAVTLTSVNSFWVVLLTPAINCRLFGYFWLVSMTHRVKNVIAGVHDTSDKMLWRQRSVLSEKLCTAWKDQGRRLRRQPLGHQNYFKPKRRYLGLVSRALRVPFGFGGLRGLWSGCVGCLWMRLFMAVPMKLSAAESDFGGRRYRRFGLS